jgi:hypothetical protein
VALVDTHDVRCEGLSAAVPERVEKDLVVLDGYRAHGGAEVKGAALEHDRVLVIHTRPLREDEERRGLGVMHMRHHAALHKRPVLHLHRSSLLLRSVALQHQLLVACRVFHICLIYAKHRIQQMGTNCGAAGPTQLL